MKSHLIQSNSLFIIQNNSLFSLWLNIELGMRSNLKIYSYFTAEEALRDIEHMKPKIILLDDTMGEGIDGQQALIQIKQLLPKTYIVILSAAKNVQIVVDLIKTGADTFIQKNQQMLENLLRVIDGI